jgi:hypothetical protein
MAHLDNLKTLQEHEEKLRAESLAIVDKSENLKENFRVVHEAMNIIYGFTHDHPHRSDDELTLQLLGIRLFNASAASVKLALSGYYQIAFAQLRDIVETYFLLDYFGTNKEKDCSLEGRRQAASQKGVWAVCNPGRIGQARRLHKEDARGCVRKAVNICVTCNLSGLQSYD